MKSLEECYQLNKKYPVRLAMLRHSVETNINYVKNLIKVDARKTRSIGVILKIIKEDLDDLDYSLKKGIMKELNIEFTTTVQSRSNQE